MRGKPCRSRLPVSNTSQTFSCLPPPDAFKPPFPLTKMMPLTTELASPAPASRTHPNTRQRRLNTHHPVSCPQNTSRFLLVHPPSSKSPLRKSLYDVAPRELFQGYFLFLFFTSVGLVSFHRLILCTIPCGQPSAL